MRGLLAVEVLAVVMGCGPVLVPGAPEPGASCAMATDAPRCMTAQSIAVCDAGRWTEFSCADTCINERQPRCRWATVGQPCPASWERGMQCLSATEAAVCTGGVWTSRSCRDCRLEGDMLLCN